jgi:hypothetical protein
VLKLKVKEKLGWGATIKIVSSRTGLTVIKNRITNVSLTEIVKALYDDTDLVIKYVAFGTSNKVLDDTDTTLDNEIFRVPVISWAPLGYGQMQSFAIMNGDEPDYAPYNGAVNIEETGNSIREIGWFCGSAAAAWGGGAGKDTGLMLSRILLTKNKQFGEEYQITRVDQIDRS